MPLKLIVMVLTTLGHNKTRGFLRIYCDAIRDIDFQQKYPSHGISTVIC